LSLAFSPLGIGFLAALPLISGGLGALGRRLVERRARVKIFGVERDRRAEVVVLNGFSAHADQSDLVAFANASRSRRWQISASCFCSSS
jgi:Cft2 family RNA processing exonuclease